MMKTIFLYAVSVLLASLSLTVSAAESITAVSFGGSYGGAQKKHMIDPYMKATGKKVLFADYNGGIAELKTQVEAGKVTWDVLDLEYIDMERACDEGLLEDLPLNTLPAGDDNVAAADDFYEGALNRCAVGNIFFSVAFAYNTKLVKGNPQTIQDFFDLDKFPGKRGLRKRPQVNLAWALIADGVATAKVYDVLETSAGLARAFKKLDTIKDDLVWYDSWSQAPQMLNDGSVVMVQAAHGRLYSAIVKDKSPFKIVWDAHAYDLDGWTIPKGSENFDAAWDFIKFATQSVPLAGMQDLAYGPTRKSSTPYLAESVKEHLPSAHIEEGYKISASFWSDNDASMSESFNAWLLK